MSSLSKNILGLFTFLPVVLLGIMFFNMYSTFLSLDTPGSPDAVGLSNGIKGALYVTMLNIFVSLGLTVTYIILALQNKKLDSNERIMWVILFVVLTPISCIIYWFMKINQDSAADNKQSF